jgi:hypothetical protein
MVCEKLNVVCVLYLAIKMNREGKSEDSCTGIQRISIIQENGNNQTCALTDESIFSDGTKQLVQLYPCMDSGSGGSGGSSGSGSSGTYSDPFGQSDPIYWSDGF